MVDQISLNILHSASIPKQSKPSYCYGNQTTDKNTFWHFVFWKYISFKEKIPTNSNRYVNAHKYFYCARSNLPNFSTTALNCSMHTNIFYVRDWIRDLWLSSLANFSTTALNCSSYMCDSYQIELLLFHMAY